MRTSACVVALIVAAGMICTARADILVGLVAPLTGTYAWVGVGAQQGAEIALADLNSQGGVLGKRIKMIAVDDYCTGDQAVAAAAKLIEAEVASVFGPLCSGAAIPASKVFADAGVLMISPVATNPRLTEQGFGNVFRVVGRDDLQGKIAGDLLAQRWGNKKIAILHDGEAYGKGLAHETKRRLNERGVTEALFEGIEPRKADYSDTVRKMQAMGVEVLYYAGYAAEAALLLRSARDKGVDLQLVGADALGVEDFGLIAGPVSEGTFFTQYPDVSERPEAAAVAARIARPGPLLGSVVTYAAVQVWAQAVEQAGTFETDGVAEALRTYEFDTVVGKIGFDKKGDVTGYEAFVWYVWKDGKQVALDPMAGTD